MGSNLTLKKNIIIKAPITDVWEAITNPKLLKNTMFGCDIITSWEIGSPILFKGNWDGNEFEDKGTILNFRQEKLYQYSYWSNFSGLPDLPENYSIIQLELIKSSVDTIVLVEQHNLATHKMYQHSENNWHIALNSLKKYIEEVIA